MLYTVKLIAKILICLADLAVICMSMITVAPITLILAIIILAGVLNNIAKDIENKE